MAVKVVSVEKKSIAEKLGILADDVLVKINEIEINDVLDYMFYISETRFDATFSRLGQEFVVKVKKDEYDDLGLNFSSFLMDEKQSCKNGCIFCFIDQMPPNMRETLYFKDDDARLSFLHGNYVTLTNLRDVDIKRIIKMRLNVNVSVHTTSPELRVKMMKNRFAGEKLSYLKELSDNGIMMNCQIVLCPNFNDKKELERTLNDLAGLMPSIQSVAVVPVGLTKYRDNLEEICPFDEKSALEAIGIIEKYQKEFLDKFGTRLVYAADEFYLTAKKELPTAKEYEDYPQYENGVGITRSLMEEFDSALVDTDFDNIKRKVSVATGLLAQPILAKLATKAMEKWDNFDCQIFGIENKFFGEYITVSGLVTGKDLIEQLKGKDLGEFLLIPNVMLKTDSNIFLDDITIDDVEEALSVKVLPVNNDGFELLEKMLGVSY